MYWVSIESKGGVEWSGVRRGEERRGEERREGERKESYAYRRANGDATITSNFDVLIE